MKRVAVAVGFLAAVLAAVLPSPAFSWDGKRHALFVAKALECRPALKKRLQPQCWNGNSTEPLGKVLDALGRGAAEPDSTDGFSSSRHSYNPRLAPSDPATLAAIQSSPEYQRRVGSNGPLLISPGKAPEAIQGEQQAVADALTSLGAAGGSGADLSAEYGQLYRHLGRLSHYLADLHSPFHANSIGIEGLEKDYVEGAIDPNTNRWVDGLWSNGPGAHGVPEWAMSRGADDVSCGDIPATSSTDPQVIAEQAAATMDGYQSYRSGGGYLGMSRDRTRGYPTDTAQVRKWGNERAAAAIGSIIAAFEQALGDADPGELNKSRPCETDDPLQPPGGDTPDDNVSAASGSAALDVEGDEAAADELRLAAKKGELQVFGRGLEEAWYEAAMLGELSEERHDELVRGLGLARDEALEAQARTRAPDVALLLNGLSASAADVLTDLVREPVRRVRPDEVGPDLVFRQPVLVIPTGGLYGLAASEQFRRALEAYVSGGGALLVFAQQRGTDFEALPTPDGQAIRGWGWAEDNSCYFNGSFIDTFHPVLASQSQALVTANVDGYFEGIPENATVLLRRVKNAQPAMFLYPLGRGFVLVSSTFDDWGTFGGWSVDSRAIIRDAVSWAKSPADLPLRAPGTDVSTTLRVANRTPLPARQVRMRLLSPWRDRVLLEETVSVGVAPGETVDVPFAHALPLDAPSGLHHVDYELLDADGAVVQPATEDDSGRIAVGRVPEPSSYRPSDLGISVVMPDGEKYLGGRPARFRYRIANRSDRSRHVRVYWELNHSSGKLEADATIAPGGLLERDVTVNAVWAGRFWLHVFEVGGPPRPRPWWADVTETAAYVASDSKGFFVVWPSGSVYAKVDPPVRLPGEPGTLSLGFHNATGIPWEGALRVRCPWSPQPLLETATTFPPGRTDFPSLTLLPPTPQPWDRQPCRIEATYEDRTVAQAYVASGVRVPSLVRRDAAFPVWSRHGPNPLSLTVENDSPVPLRDGRFRAALFDYARAEAVWEEDRALAVEAGARVALAAEAPPLPAGFGTGYVQLTARDAYGREVEAKAYVSRSFRVAASLDAGTYRAGATGEIVLSLRNLGTTREDGAVEGEIEGIGALAPEAFSLLPGGETALRFAFTVPGDVRGGAHRGQLRVGEERPVELSVFVTPPSLQATLPDEGAYAAGSELVATVRNEGGARTTQLLRLRLGQVAEASRRVLLAPGGEETLRLSIPPQQPSGEIDLTVEALTDGGGPSWSRARAIEVRGTAARLRVAMDRAVYAVGAPLAASATATNGELALDGATLHLEIRPVCSAGPPGTTYYVDTWDGTSWVTRAVRHRSPEYETDQVDLAPYLPAGEDEHRVRLRHVGSWAAEVDYVALLSEGTFVEPLEASSSHGSTLEFVRAADGTGAWIANDSLELRFPASPDPVLVFRAREGERYCMADAPWQSDRALDLAGFAVAEVADATAAPAPAGPYLLEGTVRARDGGVLARESVRFDVTDDPVLVTIGSASNVVRPGSEVAVSGLVRSLSAADEPALVLEVREDWRGTTLFTRTLDLPAGAERAYSFSFEAPAQYGGFVRAVVRRGEAVLGSALWGYRVESPRITAELRLPDPPARLVGSSPRPAVVVALDGTSDGGDVVGDLPFPLSLDGRTFTGFRQSPSGFLQLLGGPEDLAWPPGLCLEEAPGLTAIAPAFGALDATAGRVGYRQFAAGSNDGAGRAFDQDTIVFVWDAPSTADGQPNRFQLEMGRDGLVRIEGQEVSARPGCGGRTGLVLAGRGIAVAAPTAPFALRLESGVGREPWTGALVLRNEALVAGAVEADYGPVDGPRRTQTVTLGAGEEKALPLEGVAGVRTDFSFRLTGDASLSGQRSVEPNEALFVEFTGERALEPGQTRLPLLVRKRGVSGRVDVAFVLAGPGGNQTVTRTYDLEPGVTATDALPFVLSEGAAVLSVEADGVRVEGGPVELRVAPRRRASLEVVARAPSDGELPFVATVANTGLEPFSGSVSIDGGGAVSAPVGVPPGETAQVELRLDLGPLAAGRHDFRARLVADDGAVLQEVAVGYEVLGPRVRVVDSPEGASFEAGAVAALRFALENEGDAPARGEFEMRVLDEVRVAPIDLGPGQRAEIEFGVPLDTGFDDQTHVAHYDVRVDGVPASSGQASFRVAGISLSVRAALDATSYEEGATARFTVEIANDRPEAQTSFRVRVSYAGVVQDRSVVVEGTASETFAVPLPRITGELLHLAVSTPEGVSVHIDTFQVRGRDPLARVTIDGQVYAPGAAVTVSAAPVAAGTLRLQAPGYEEELALAGPVSRTFVLPADLAGGTHSVSWSFRAQDGRSSSGSVAFDVTGLRVRVLEAGLDRGRYEPGETITSRLLVRANLEAEARLRTLVVDPEGEGTLLGEAALLLDPGEDVLAVHGWPFGSTRAGLHRLVYEILRGETVLARGLLAFDTGSASVLSVRTGRGEYPGSSEPVGVVVSTFAARAATLRLEVDGTTAASRDLHGTGLEEVTVDLTGLAPGLHEVAGVVEDGGASSRRAAFFALGTGLPDLVVRGISARATGGAAMRIDALVRNEGGGPAAATDLVVEGSATGVALGTAPVPPLGAGASATVSLDWSASGHPGALPVTAVADASGVVREFDESNNRLPAILSVPDLVLRAAAEARYPAQAVAVFEIAATNLTADRTFEGLGLRGQVVGPGSVASLPPVPLPPVGPASSVPATLSWAVGRSAPGDYVLRVELADPSGRPLALAGAPFVVEPTPSFAGSVAASPSPAAANGRLDLAATIENRGNVDVSGLARFDVVAPDRTVTARATTAVEVASGATASLEATIETLRVLAGEYSLELSVETAEASYPVASIPLRVSGGSVTASLGPDPTERVLVHLGERGKNALDTARRRAFVSSSLAGTAFEVASNGLEFARLFRSGLFDTHVLFADAPLLVPVLGDELREAVYRGQGLVVAQVQPACTRELDAALGARAASVLPVPRHEVVVPADSPLGPEARAYIPAPVARLQAATARVAGVFESGSPAITTHEFGQGRSVLLGFDPAVAGSSPPSVLPALLARSVAFATPGAARPVAPGTVLPLAVTVVNETDMRQAIDVALDLSPELDLAGVEDDPQSADPVSWSLALAAGETRSLRFQVVIPDAPGSYSVEASVRADGRSLPGGPSLRLDVARSTNASLAETIDRLEAVDAAPGEGAHLGVALARLRLAASLPARSPWLELRIRLAAEAAEAIGRLASVDLRGERLAIGAILSAWERSAPDGR